MGLDDQTVKLEMQFRSNRQQLETITCHFEQAKVERAKLGADCKQLKIDCIQNEWRNQLLDQAKKRVLSTQGSEQNKKGVLVDLIKKYQEKITFLDSNLGCLKREISSFSESNGKLHEKCQFFKQELHALQTYANCVTN